MNTQNGTNLEGWLGGKLVGVLAALLVLAGLALLGAAFIPELPDVAKAALITLFALGLTAAGTLLVQRHRNVFTCALLACGMAAFFVAIVAAYAYFGLITHTAALVAAGAWMAVTAALLALTRSWALDLVMLVTTGIAGVSALEGTGGQPGFAAAFFLVAAYCAALSLLGVRHAAVVENAVARASSMQPNGTAREKALASVFVAEAMVFLAASESAWLYSEHAALLLLGIVLLALKCAPLPPLLASSSFAMRANELAIAFAGALFFALNGMAGGLPALPAHIMLGAFVCTAVVLAGLRALDLADPAKPRPAHALPVLRAFALTWLLLGFLIDISSIVHSPYVWSAVCMVCALLAIGAGFWFGEKPLRVYGLVVALLCVLKIALFDLNGDSLAHAAALVAAGLACFAISALYTFASKRPRAIGRYEGVERRMR